MLSNHISRTIEVFQRPQQTQQPRVFSCCVCVVDPSNIGLQLAQSSHGVRRHSCHGHGSGIWNLHTTHCCGAGNHSMERAARNIFKICQRIFLANLACDGE